jgi:hypothetical protein
MAFQFSVAARNAALDAIETAAGTTPRLTVRTGAAPADCATANSGTVIATMNLPSDWMAGASAGQKTFLGTWQDAAADATGTVGHFRIHDSTGATCHLQGTAGQNVVFATNAITAANGNVLTFASTTGVVVGANVSGTGVAPGSTVVAVTGTTVTLSSTSTAGVASGATITFAYDLAVDNASVVVGQQFSVTGFTLIGGNA